MINLREYKTSDLERLQYLANNENVSRYMTTAFPYPYTQEDARWWVETGCKSGIVRVIEFNGEFVGTVGGNAQANEGARTAVVGYWVGEPYWGKGIACEALKLLSQLIFSATDIIRLEASIYSPNVASMRVAEKAGYEEEAILRNAIFKNNETFDRHIYSMLRD